MLATKMKRKKKKNVALGLLAQGAHIQYATEMDSDLLIGLPIGTPVEIHPKPNRNIAHHRKYFAMMKMGLEYWKPDVHLITKSEIWVAHKVAKEFASLSQNKDFYDNYGKDIANKVVTNLSIEREKKLNVDIFYNLDLYRRKIMIDAGFFDYIVLEDGDMLREPWSISFDDMSQEKFNEIYRGCFNQIWQQTLFQIFPCQSEAQKAIDQVMHFL